MLKIYIAIPAIGPGWFKPLGRYYERNKENFKKGIADMPLGVKEADGL
jgi:hypothetical protein